MPNSRSLPTIATLLCHGLAIGQGSWTERAPFAGLERDRTVGFTIGNKAYIGTGSDDSTGVWTAELYNDFWEWDEPSNTWAQKASFGGTARAGAIGFAIGTKGYIGTGWDGFVTGDFWEWDQAGNAWTQKADLPGPWRYAAVGFSLNGKGYLCGGFDIQSTESYNDLWEFDPIANSWTQKASLPADGRYWSGCFTINDKGYVAGGFNWGLDQNIDEFWEYDPDLDHWTQRATCPATARIGTIGFSIGGKGYLGGGLTNVVHTFASDFWEYDPLGDQWNPVADLPSVERGFAPGFSIGGSGYTGTGLIGNKTYTVEFWEFEPTTTGTSRLIVDRSIGLYPQPCSSHASLIINDRTLNDRYSAVEVLDLLGQVVLTTPISGPRQELSTSALAAGTYQVRLNGRNGPTPWAEKLIVMR
jgi:N-acetylneuraminic acid mutarotase